MTTNPTIEQTCAEATPAETMRSARSFSPNVDIIERGNELLLLADMPGTTAEDIEVRYENGLLAIHGRVPADSGRCTGRGSCRSAYMLHEYGVGDFHREFRIGEGLDAGKITAQYQHGVLTLRLPKSERAMTKKIAVKAG